MANKLIQFGTGSKQYIFDEAVLRLQSGRLHFSDWQPAYMNAFGLDGGLSMDGGGRARATVGTAQAFFLFRNTGNISNLTALRTQILRMGSWGEQKLVKELEDGQRVWTWATVTNISPIAESYEDLSYTWQKGLQINWTCPKAVWYGKVGLSSFNDYELGSFANVPAPTVDRLSVVNGQTIQLTNNGSAYAGVFVRWDCPVGESITNPTLTRRNDAGQIEDQIQYVGTMSGGDVVEIDARNHLTRVNGGTSNEYSKLSYYHADWLQLPPGDSTIEVSGTFSSSATLTIDYWDTYK